MSEATAAGRQQGILANTFSDTGALAASPVKQVFSIALSKSIANKSFQTLKSLVGAGGEYEDYSPGVRLGEADELLYLTLQIVTDELGKMVVLCHMGLPDVVSRLECGGNGSQTIRGRAYHDRNR